MGDGHSRVAADFPWCINRHAGSRKSLTLRGDSFALDATDKQASAIIYIRVSSTTKKCMWVPKDKRNRQDREKPLVDVETFGICSKPQMPRLNTLQALKSQQIIMYEGEERDLQT